MSRSVSEFFKRFPDIPCNSLLIPCSCCTAPTDSLTAQASLTYSPVNKSTIASCLNILTPFGHHPAAGLEQGLDKGQRNPRSEPLFNIFQYFTPHVSVAKTSQPAI